MLFSKPFKYLFLVVFQWHMETNPARNPTILPAVVVTVLLSLNILAAIQALRCFVGNTPLLNTFPNSSRVLGYICYLVVGGIVWVSFVKNGAYRRFEAEFATASTGRRRKRTVAVTFYIVVSVCLPFVLKALWHSAHALG
jgi:hypothetical protein